jgi:hypothetical protein
VRLPGGPDGDTEARRVNVSLVVVVVACLLPYFNIGPFSAPSQVQPWPALLAWLWVAPRALRSGLRFSAVQCLLLLFAAYFMIHVYGEEGFDFSTYLRRSGAFLLSAGIFLAGQYLTPATMWRALKVTIPIWLAFGALRYIDSTIYYSVVTPLVPTVVVSDERGTSSLAPEATDFGFTMVFVVVLCMITRRRLTQQGIHAEKWPLVAAVASVLLSLSGTGYLGLAVVGAVYVLAGPAGKFGRIGRSSFGVLMVICTVTIISLLPSQTVRGIELLRLAIQDPIALMDTTTSYRVVHTVVGVFGIADSGFWGYGAGSFGSEAPDVYYRHHLGNIFGIEGYYAERIPVSLGGSPASQFGLILLEFGVVGVLYLTLLFGFAMRSRIPLKAVAIAVLFLAWLGSFPIAWPPFWVVIGIMMSPHFVAHEALAGLRPPQASVGRRRGRSLPTVTSTRHRADSMDPLRE